MSTAEWERLLFLNLLAPIVVTRALIPTLLAQDEAHVLNGCSIFGLVPAKRGRLPSQQVWFGGLSAALRAEYGSDFGVTSLCPGFVRTPLLSNFATDPGKKRHEIPPWLCAARTRWPRSRSVPSAATRAWW